MKARFLAAIAVMISSAAALAVGLDDIKSWAGTGTNRAAMVIEWSSPDVRNNTSVPNPAAQKSLAWGYRWNGAATAQDMLVAILAADHRLFAIATPPGGFGIYVYSLGYDLNNNGVFGARQGTNVIAENGFTNGMRVISSEDPDALQSLDPCDLFWSGSFGPGWELWNDLGNHGGFTNAPDRGSNPYWTPDDTNAPYSGHHGQWEYSQAGLSGLNLTNGSWIGFTVAAGGLNFSNPDDPGTLAYNFHRHAPDLPTPAATNSTYVVQVVAAQGPFGASPYDDTNCVLGVPATRFFESASKPATRVKLVESAYNYSVTDGQTNKLIITLNNGSSIIGRFDHPVYDNPVNPYGVDFEVFGNAFYVGNGFSSDTANMNTHLLTSGGFYEPTKISVSPGYTGLPGEDANDPATWPWYRYNNGPYGDTDCPTHAYKWNRTGTNWTDELLDFTKPVNPALKARLNASGSTLSAADAIDLYNGSGGGTGFDLKDSGFASIQYIKAEGISPAFNGGEIDAFSIVRPMTIGDNMSIAPDNLAANTARLFFQQPGNENQNVLSLNFTAIGDAAQVATARLDDPVALGAVPGLALNAVALKLSAILGTNTIGFAADCSLSTGGAYDGNGGDLRVFQWTGTNWAMQPFAFNSTSHIATVSGTTNLSAFVLAQVIAPQLAIRQGTNGYVFQFQPVPNWTHVLQRSSDFTSWTTVSTTTPTNALPITLQDSGAPLDKGFYRLRLSYP